MNCFVLSRRAAICGRSFTRFSAQNRARQSISYRRSIGSNSRPSVITQFAPDMAFPGLVDNVWKQDQQHVEYPALDKDITTDVCIVGAGIAGVTLAYELVRAGRSVVLLEGKVRGAGMTGKTTAHVMQWNDDYYSEIEKLHGLSGAKLVADSHVKAVDKIRDIVTMEKIDCGFAVVPGYLFPHNASDALSTLDEELAACQRAGVLGVEKVELPGTAKVGSITTAIKFPHSADFHPLKYINGVAKAVKKHGGQIFERSQVSTAHNEKVTTMDGHVVTCRNGVVLATNSPITKNLAVHSRQEPWRSYVVGLAVPKGSVERAQYWSTEEIYHYIRIEEHDSKTDVLIVGGEDHQTGIRPEKYQPAYENLINFARKYWPQAGEVLYKWTGQVYEPMDLLGLYGLDPLNMAHPSHYIITGHSGQGMTGGTIGAMIVADALLERPNPWANLYSPSRLPPPSLTTAESLAQQVGMTTRGFADRVLPRGLDDIKGALMPQTVESQLKIGDGMVVQEGVFGPHHVALYKDSDGVVHRKSAVCPHLQCLVEWNPAEKTFDCPCHGSQFDCYGKLVCGPAEKDLEELGTW